MLDRLGAREVAKADQEAQPEQRAEHFGEPGAPLVAGGGAVPCISDVHERMGSGVRWRRDGDVGVL
eukprot:4521512-Prymnesium_polylepis.2